MKYGFKEKEIHMGLFDFTIVVIFGDYKNIDKYIQWKFDDKDFNSSDSLKPRGKTFCRVGYVPVIWLPKKPRTSREYGILAHEAFHAIFNMFTWANIPLTEDTEEVVAHSLSHIVNEVLKDK